MLVHKIIYILLLTILGVLVFYKNTPEKIYYFKDVANKFIHDHLIERFSNKLTESIKCNGENSGKSDDTRIVDYINKNHSIFKKHDIEKDFGIEISTKFSKDIINFERMSFFAHFSLIKKNNTFKDEIMTQFSGRDDVTTEITNTLTSIIDKDGQLIYGKDFKNNYNRVYLNYKETNEKYIIYGYEWNDSHYNYKKYVSLENKSNIIKILSELFGSNITQTFIKIFKEYTWDVLLEKSDSNSQINKSNSYYFSFKIDPILKNIYDELKQLLLLFNNQESAIEKWYECNKGNVISWVTVSLNKDNTPELNIYFVSSDDGMEILTESINKLMGAKKMLDNMIL
jgi:hypothetical protein